MKVSGGSVAVPVGGGAVWQSFLQRLDRAAQSDASLCIVGEHGVGRGFLAKRVHATSPRCRGPLVELDLSEGSPTLVESLLFGHEEGAFTGAHKQRLGAARRAEGGTLVLRGIDELDRTLQVKLLRLLQERVVEPLGSDRTFPVDVRMIATASPALPDRVAKGSFREDLFYRLAVVVLDVPPLRARLEGIDGWLPPMVDDAARRVGRAPRPVAAEALLRLAAHPWPGNVRELENALERVLVLGGPDRVGQPVDPAEFDFLPQAVNLDEALQDLARQGLALGVAADRWEGALLEQAFSDHRGRVAAAARALGLTRKAFEYRLQRFREGLGSQDGGGLDADGEEEELGDRR